nr:radical SAM protein [Anaerolineaceae bacterium]
MLNKPGEIIDYIESLCPLCLKVVESKIVVQDQAVYLKKICPDHGPDTVYIWPDADHYNWMRNFRLPFLALNQFENIHDKCPTSCGLCSQHLRHSTLVEVEITHNCNLHCPVCFMCAETNIPEPSLDTIESVFKDIFHKAKKTNSLQLTGGEPTIRKDLPEIIRRARRIGFSAIEVNTNGIVIAQKPEFIQDLVKAGITGFYLQFDGLTSSVYKMIRGKDLLKEKLQA